VSPSRVRPSEARPGATLSAVLLTARPNVTADSALINRAKLGDAEAFTAIVERYYPRALRFARGLLRNPADAEDVVQDAFIRIYRAMPRYEERQRFDAWLFRILGNCCRSANVSHHRRDSLDVDDENAIERIPSTDTTDGAFELEFGDEVRRALAEVPDYNREIFLLHHIEGFSYEEIEKMTGVRQSALKMRVKRASDLLRARLAGVYRG
jgi:RNA polymerase sigma-70 factor, ECF subfamily